MMVSIFTSIVKNICKYDIRKFPTHKIHCYSSLPPQWIVCNHHQFLSFCILNMTTCLRYIYLLWDQIQIQHTSSISHFPLIVILFHKISRAWGCIYCLYKNPYLMCHILFIYFNGHHQHSPYGNYITLNNCYLTIMIYNINMREISNDVFWLNIFFPVLHIRGHMVSHKSRTDEIFRKLLQKDIINIQHTGHQDDPHQIQNGN